MSKKFIDNRKTSRYAVELYWRWINSKKSSGEECNEKQQIPCHVYEVFDYFDFVRSQQKYFYEKKRKTSRDEGRLSWRITLFRPSEQSEEESNSNYNERSRSRRRLIPFKFFSAASLSFLVRFGGGKAAKKLPDTSREMENDFLVCAPPTR